MRNSGQLAGKLKSAHAGKNAVLFLEQRAGDENGVFDFLKINHARKTLLGAVHDRCRKPRPAVGLKLRPGAGIKEGIIFELPDRESNRFNRVCLGEFLVREFKDSRKRFTNSVRPDGIFESPSCPAPPWIIKTGCID